MEKFQTGVTQLVQGKHKGNAVAAILLTFVLLQYDMMPVVKLEIPEEILSVETEESSEVENIPDHKVNINFDYTSEMSEGSKISIEPIQPEIVSAGKEVAEFSAEVLDGFQVTYYNITGITKSGEHTKDGVTVAVDPNVIPLGTWLKITLPDGTVYKRKATDTGKLIKGRIIDIYMKRPSSELRKLGRVHNVKVEILGDV